MLVGPNRNRGPDVPPEKKHAQKTYHVYMGDPFEVGGSKSNPTTLKPRLQPLPVCICRGNCHSEGFPRWCEMDFVHQQHCAFELELQPVRGSNWRLWQSSPEKLTETWVCFPSLGGTKKGKPLNKNRHHKKGTTKRITWLQGRFAEQIDSSRLELRVSPAAVAGLQPSAFGARRGPGASGRFRDQITSHLPQ